ncbi:RHS repeat-associated core domain-containing protein [Chryseobacterium vrystaatense]|uniref:RHS repeat-associated core domain-containing protein n=1 Tax=Chryseobacterium vrystaatense TaxID=307480 RepID=UPI0029372B4F|nr:RHS repeat-associated core domain-containing protein [Chryseobacterium vrystaatense]
MLDTNNYYPFGLNHTGGNVLNSSGFGSWQSYKYNGKELQETGMYDYGARFYMADLGRWGVIDPMAEQMSSHSPYNYVFNNPISFTDPSGMLPKLLTAQSHDEGGGGGGGQVGRWTNPNWVGFGNAGNYGESYAFGSLYTSPSNSSSGGGNNYLLDHLIASWAKEGIYASVSKNGYLTYWTRGAAQNGNTLEEMVGHMLNLSSSDGAEIRQSYHNFNPYKPDNTPEWYAFGGRSNFGIASAATGLDALAGEARVTTHGPSIKVYRPNANGNVFIKNQHVKTIGIGTIASRLGIFSFGLGLAMDLRGVQIYNNDPTSPNAVHPAKAALNTVMSAYGLTGAGTIPSLLYFGVDAFYPGGWEGYGNDYQSIQSRNSAIIPGFITAPYGSQKF